MKRRGMRATNYRTRDIRLIILFTSPPLLSFFNKLLGAIQVQTERQNF